MNSIAYICGWYILTASRAGYSANAKPAAGVLRGQFRVHRLPETMRSGAVQQGTTRKNGVLAYYARICVNFGVFTRRIPLYGQGKRRSKFETVSCNTLRLICDYIR